MFVLLLQKGDRRGSQARRCGRLTTAARHGVHDGEELILLLLDSPQLANHFFQAGAGSYTVGSHGGEERGYDSLHNPCGVYVDGSVLIGAHWEQLTIMFQQVNIHGIL